jgi:tRNA pseudouridine55 synthase
MAENGAHGLLVLDKPSGMTSRDALDRALAWFPKRTRIGHTGTLDPLATGVLVICLGHATRLAEYIQAMQKTYRATFLLGARSDTDDADGEITPVSGVAEIDETTVRRALASFIRDLDQVPPAYSAALVAGRRAYSLARRGKLVELSPRRVTIHGIDLFSYEWPNLEVEVRCGKGTYIRSLARDLGENLGCGGLVAALRRTRVGPFHVEDAVTLEMGPAQARMRLRPLADALAELPRVEVTDNEARLLRHGQRIPSKGEGESGVFDAAGNLIGVGLFDEAGQWLRPIKILPALN